MRAAAIIVLLAGAALADEPKPTASVLDPKVSGVPSEEAEIIGEAIRDAVVAAGKYRVQDRAAMREILAQQQLNSSEVCDESCMVEQGRMLQVRFLVSSTARRVEGMTVISVRMTDVESGEVVGTARDSCQACNAYQQMSMAEALANQVITGEKKAIAASSRPPPSPAQSYEPAPESTQRPPPSSEPPPPGFEPPIVGVRGSASLGYLAPAGMVFAEGGLGHWSLRLGAGGGVDFAALSFSAIGIGFRYSRDTDGGGWYGELGSAFLTYDAADVTTTDVTIGYGIAGWRWQGDSGLYFQLGGGILASADSSDAVLPTLNLELGWALWFR